MTGELRTWTPFRLRAFLRESRDVHFDDGDRELFMRLASDENMREFWEWLDATNDKVSDQGYELDPLSVFWSAVRGTEQLEKPASLPPKEKTKYLADVKKHAAALVDLLSSTQFDLRLDRFCEQAGLDVSDFYDTDHYPSCTLTEQLEEVICWAEQPDCHDSAGNPTWMIRQGGESACRHFLAAELVRMFDQMVGELPPSQLFADLMSVILESEVSAVAAQKIVQRIRDRKSGIVYEKIDGHAASLLDRYMLGLLKVRD